MSLTRKYKLYKLGICPDDNYAETLKFLYFKLSDIQLFITVEYPDWMYFMTTEGENLIQFNPKQNTLFVKRECFGYDLVIKFELKYEELQNFIKNLVEEYCDLTIETSMFPNLPTFYFGMAPDVTGIEDLYKEHIKNELTKAV